jgi:hypothetical protein
VWVKKNPHSITDIANTLTLGLRTCWISIFLDYLHICICPAITSFVRTMWGVSWNIWLCFPIHFLIIFSNHR